MGNNTLQTDYSPRQQEGLLGAVPDLSGLQADRRYLNDDPRAKQIETVTVATASDDTDYTVTIDGNDLTITSDGSATKTEIRDALIDAINNEPLVNGTVLAEAGNSDDFTITARIGGVGFTFSESDSNLTSTETQANATANPVEFGRAVEFTGFSTNSRPLARKVDASHFTKRHLRISVDSVQNSTNYVVHMEINGELKVAKITSDGSATGDEVTNSLQSAIDGLSNLISATADTGSDNVEIKAETAGFADFQVLFAGPTADLTTSVEAAGTDINEIFAGCAKRNENLPADPDTDPNLEKYPAGENMTVRAYGPMFVETENNIDLGANPDGPAFVRLSANGSNDQLGVFRSDYNSGCVPLKGAQFIDEGNTYDTLQIQGARV